jgi:hypothetical protein
MTNKISKTSTVRTTPFKGSLKKSPLSRDVLNDLSKNKLSNNHFSGLENNIQSSYIIEHAQIQLPIDAPIHIEDQYQSSAKESLQDTTQSFRGCSEVSLELDFEIL